MNAASWGRRVEQAPRIAEAAAILVTTRWLLRLSPGFVAGRLLGNAGRGASTTSGGQRAEKVVRAVERVAPWVSGATCLSRALTGWVMLRRRGIGSVVRVGARRDPAGKVSMHAWLEVAGRACIDSDDAGSFVPMSP